MESKFKTTNTTLSVGTEIHNDTIARAKSYLSNNYNNKYNLDPHFNFIIIAMPESNIKKVEIALDDYFKDKKTLNLLLSTLDYEPKHKFFSIPVVGKEVMNFHKELLNILNGLRDGCIREKDIEKMQDGTRDPEEIQNIKLYGYPRVLSKFTPHITIGNVGLESFDIKEITNKLNTLLEGIFNKTIEIRKIGVSFYEEAEFQTDLKFLWTKEYDLGGDGEN
jgi:hypothetical protein